VGTFETTRYAGWSDRFVTGPWRTVQRTFTSFCSNNLAYSSAASYGTLDFQRHAVVWPIIVNSINSNFDRQCIKGQKLVDGLGA
jgi:hypothetical protein